MSAGVTVTATSVAATTAKAYAQTIGAKNAPGRPPSTAIGRIASKATSVAYTSGRLAAAEATAMVDVTFGVSPASRLSCRLRTTRALGATASSTTMAMAAARPAKTSAFRP